MLEFTKLILHQIAIFEKKIYMKDVQHCSIKHSLQMSHIPPHQDPCHQSILC